jgi:hypothetical protein
VSSHSADVSWPGSAATGLALFILLHLHPKLEVLALPAFSVALLYGVLRDRFDFRMPMSRVEIAFLLLAGVWLGSAWMGLDAGRSLRLSVPAAVTLLGVFALGRDRAGPGEAWLMAALLSLASLAGAFVLLAALHGAATPEARVEAAGASWLVVPNDLAWAVCLWPWWWRAAWRMGRGASIALVALLTLQLAAFVLLHSRLALLMVAVVLGVSLLRGRGPGSILVLVAVGAIALILAFAAKGTGGLLARFELWQSAWEVFLAQPWLGVGPHNFVLAYLDHVPGVPLDPRLTPWPHNLPLELMASVGLAGAVVFGFLVVCAAENEARLGKLDLVTVAAVVVLVSLEASTLRIWFWMLLLVWLGAVSRRIVRESNRG